MVSGEVVAYVALGSNLGDRAAHLRAALEALRSTPGLRVAAVSSFYETEPVGGPPQDPYWNAAVELRSALNPRELLERLLAIEAREGRRRGPVKDAPRSLDLDLLLYGEERIEEPELEVPHPRLHERAFVLEPLREIAPKLRHPVLDASIEELAKRVRHRSAVRRIGE